MKIDSSIKSLTRSGAQAPAARPGATPAAGAGVSAGASQVQLSPQATALLGAESVLNETAVVDTKRVAEIKQAIAEGRFSINPEKIADGLLDNVRQMLKNQPQG